MKNVKLKCMYQFSNDFFCLINLGLIEEWVKNVFVAYFVLLKNLKDFYYNTVYFDNCNYNNMFSCFRLTNNFIN